MPSISPKDFGPSMQNPISNFSHGFMTVGRAARFLRAHPRLAGYIAIPLLINITIFSLAVWGGVSFFDNISARFLPHGEAWYWLLVSYLLWIIAIAVTAVLVFFSFTVIGNLIASPFNEILSEKTEQIITDRHLDEPFSFNQFLSDATRTILEESRKMSFFVLGMLFLFLLNLLPLVGSLAYAALSILWTIFFLAVEYTGYTFARKRLKFADQRRFMSSHLSLMAGFGSGLICLLAIPFLQFFTIPLGVIGATMLVLETAFYESSPVHSTKSNHQ